MQSVWGTVYSIQYKGLKRIGAGVKADIFNITQHIPNTSVHLKEVDV